MDAEEPSNDIKDHGTVFDRKRVMVHCNYCRTLIHGFCRLKFHLGGVRGGGRLCPKVPVTVKELYQNEVYERKRGSGLKRELALLDPLEELPLKRNCPQRSNSFKIRFESESLTCFDALNLSSFEDLIFMCSTARNSRIEYKGYKDLEGPFPQAEVTKVQDCVKKIKESWSRTGCSILLESWRDEQGRELIMFLADCPQGPIYIQSSDVSSVTDDIDALQSMLNKVIEVVGTQNVVQIVVCSTAGWLGRVGQQFMDRCKTRFWTVSASHCVDLMLEKIGLMDSVKPILEKAWSLKKFMLKGNFSLVESLDLSYPCFEGNLAAIPFLALENTAAVKERLKALVNSSEWEASVWAATEEGKKMDELVRDPSFWSGVKMVMKASVPLVRLSALIRCTDKPLTGFIYEAMDQVKEAIKEEFKSIKSQFMPFWRLIDEIWESHLHTPLHAAGYYLNPSLFYSINFHPDLEVAFGLLCSIVRLVQDAKTQDLIALQLDKYRLAEGAFEEGSSIECIDKPPLEWWSVYGAECPELQRFAIRVLSQTCEGASIYGLKKDMAQKLQAGSMRGLNRQEQVRLRDLAFIHYNLQLRNFKEEGMDAESCHEELGGH